LQIIQPQFEILSDPVTRRRQGSGAVAGDRRIVPIYETASHGKLTHAGSAGDPRRTGVAGGGRDGAGSDTCPIRERLKLMEKAKSFWQTHWPEPDVI